MICPTCNTESTHIRIDSHGTGCHNCRGFSESGGSQTDKILTRNAERITTEHIQYEGDIITPYVVDKNTNKAVVNEEFINLYPEQAAQTYSQDELKSIGQPDLRPREVADDTQGIEFSGSEETAVKEIMGEI